jgi:hypothetical protein
MNPDPEKITAIHNYSDFLKSVFEKQLKDHFSDKTATRDDEPFPEVITGTDHYPLTDFITKYQLTNEEIILLLIALIPHINPHFIDKLIQKHIPNSGDFPEIGGVRGKNHRGFLPTAETVLFILAGNDLERRMECEALFSNDHLFSKLNVLTVEEPQPGEPRYSGKLIMSPEYIELFTTGKISHPKMKMDFPAQYVTTGMEWNDIVLSQPVLRQLEDLKTWVDHHNTLMQDWGMHRKLKPGYRALFHGPPGTGKTLTATLLGKSTGKDVFKIDLSMVVSKFIGETEKNLANLFNRAENKNWILFFDEADALFSKRTNVRDAHDKYANQEASYLLQRIENFDGLVILATNFKSNIDDAFLRRFHSIIHFPAPTPSERIAIWQKGFPGNVTFHENVDLSSIAKSYELTGASIMSVVQYCCLQAISRNISIVDNEMILTGIKREYNKEGKIW